MVITRRCRDFIRLCIFILLSVVAVVLTRLTEWRLLGIGAMFLSIAIYALTIYSFITEWNDRCAEYTEKHNEQYYDYIYKEISSSLQCTTAQNFYEAVILPNQISITLTSPYTVLYKLDLPSDMSPVLTLVIAERLNNDITLLHHQHKYHIKLFSYMTFGGKKIGYKISIA